MAALGFTLLCGGRAGWLTRKRVERLMREMGLVGKAAKLYRRKPAPTNPCITVGNQRRLECPPSQENQHWAGDATYLKLNGSWVYLAVTLDLYSRRVVGWDLGPARTAELTASALNRAIATRDVGLA